MRWRKNIWISDMLFQLFVISPNNPDQNRQFVSNLFPISVEYLTEYLNWICELSLVSDVLTTFM